MTHPSPDLIDLLCDFTGLERVARDADGEPDTAALTDIRAVLEAMGLPAGTPAAAAESARRAAAQAWRPGLAPVITAPPGRRVLRVVYTAPREVTGPLDWRLTIEGGGERGARLDPDAMTILAKGSSGAVPLTRWRLDLPVMVEPGIHGLAIIRTGRDAEGQAEIRDEARVIAPPRRLTRAKALAQGQKTWGLAVPLARLASARNWGVGDFTDLADLTARAARLGAGFVAPGPLHAGGLAPDRADRPSSRRFLDPIYLDLDAVPDRTISASAMEHRSSDAFAARLETARETRDIALIRTLKTEIAGHLYAGFKAHFLDRDGGPWGRGLGFLAYRDVEGETLRRFAVFQVLSGHLAAQGHGPDWRSWPDAYRDPASPAVAAFARDHADAVACAEYQQWLCEAQLSMARARGRAARMAVGLITTLSPGPAPGGAEVWADRQRFLGGVEAETGHALYDRDALLADGYTALSDVIRPAMRQGDALFVDAAAGLWRLPCRGTGQAKEQAVIRPRTEDLLTLLAAHARETGCMVIAGGPLSPDQMADLDARGILSGVAMAAPARAETRARLYPRLAMVSAASDPARPGLGSDGGRVDAILTAEAMLKTAGAGRGPAVTRFLARTPSILAAVTLDDLAGRASERIDYAAVLADPAVIERAGAIAADRRKRWRQAGTGSPVSG